MKIVLALMAISVTANASAQWLSPRLAEHKSVPELQLMTPHELITEAYIACEDANIMRENMGFPSIPGEALQEAWIRMRQDAEYIERIGRVVRAQAKTKDIPPWIEAFLKGAWDGGTFEMCGEAVDMARRALEGTK